MTVKGIPGSGLGGGVTIGNVVTPFISKKHTEANTILKAYDGNYNRVFMGLVKMWNRFNIESTPILNATELENEIIRTDGFGAELDFLLPYEVDPVRVRAYVIDVTVARPGEGGTKFPVVLSDQMSPGDVLSLKSLRSGYQIRVSDKDDIEPFGDGDGWEHQCYTIGDSPEDYTPREFLSEGVAVLKLDNPGSEHSVHSTSISADRRGILQQSYKTANSQRRITHTVTSYGDILGQNIQSKSGSNIFTGLFNYQNMTPADLNSITNYYNVDPKSKEPNKAIPGSRTWVPSIIEMMYREKALIKERYLTWGQGATWVGKGDQQVTIGDGWYQQVKKRGWYREYDDTSKIIDVMKDMMDQLFFKSNKLPKDRSIVFTMGMGAMVAAQQAFQEHAFGRNMFMIVNDGKNPITNGIFTGDSQNLKFKMPRVISVEFPEYGTIEIKHNPALDFLDGDEEDQLRRGRYNNSSYMMWVEDVTSSEFSNAIPKGAYPNTIPGVNQEFGRKNVVMIRPKGDEDTLQFLVGTGVNPTLRTFVGASNVVSTEEKGFKIIMDFAGEIFIKEPWNIYIAEYKPRNTFY